LSLTGFVAYAPVKTPVFSLFSCRSSSDFRDAATRYSLMASAGVAAPPVQRESTSSGQAEVTS